MVKNINVKENKRGFTLIELLAVIIILGVLLIIAIPAISRYIEDSRRNTYINSVKSVVNAISVSVNNLEYPIPNVGEAIIVPFSEANLEKGTAKTKSPYATYVEGKSYVIVTFSGNTYNYYVVALDDAGFAIPLINDKDLNAKSITTDVSVINNNIYSLADIKKGNLIDTSSFAIKYKGESGNIIKVKLCESVYNKGDIIQLKDGTKWYSISSSNEDSKTVDLVSYNHMDTYSYNYGFQSNSKTMPTIVFDSNGSVVYENASISQVGNSIISATYIKLVERDINMTGATVGMPKLVDFCGENYDEYTCSRTINYLGSDGGFWTTDVSDNGKYVIGIVNQAFSYTKPSYGSLATDKGYGIRVVIRNLQKSNINKEATKALN